MSFRRQLPVRSPVTGRGLLAGLAGLGGGAAAAVQAAEEAVRTRWSPDALALVDSGTSALALALRGAATLREAAGVPEPLVALPAYGCYDLATAALAAGVRAVLYDVDPGTLAPVVASLEAALEREPAAVVLAYLYGYPIDVAGLGERIRSAGALVVEDAAQGSGLRIGDRPAGTLGDLAVLSFGRGKGIAAGGGGAVLARGERAVGALEASGAARVHPPARGWGAAASFAAQWTLARPAAYGIPASLPFLGLGETRFHQPWSPGPITGFSAAVIPVALELEAAEVRGRRARAERLLEWMEGRVRSRGRHPEGFGAPRSAISAEPGYLRLPVLVSPALRLRFDSDAARRLGVMPGYPESLDRLNGFGERCLVVRGGCPGARRLAAELFTLPTHGKVSARDEAALVAWLEAAGPGPASSGDDDSGEVGT